MSPADGWWWPEPRSPMGSTKPRAEPLPPSSVGVGTLWERPGSTGALGLTVGMDSETAPHRTGSGAFTACRHYVIRAGTILESRHEAEVCGSGWHSLRTLGS